jgi:hypothetical protein
MRKNNIFGKNTHIFILAFLGTSLIIGSSLDAAQEQEEKEAPAVHVGIGIEMGRAVSHQEIISAETLLSQSNIQLLKEYGTPAMIASELEVLAQENNPAYQQLAAYYNEKANPAVRVTGARAHGPFAAWDKETDKEYGRLQNRVVPIVVSHIIKKKKQLVYQDQLVLEEEDRKQKAFWWKWAPLMGIVSALELIAFIGSMIYIGTHPDTCGSK